MEDRSRLRENRNRWSASDSLRTRCQWRAKRFNQHSMCPEGRRNILFLAHGHSSIMILQVADNRKTERVASRAGRNNIWRFARIELEFPRACPMAMPTSLLQY